jgi:hypothetical protein
MKINDTHPDFSSFIQNEFKTIGFLRNQPYLNENLTDLNIAANTFYDTYNSRFNNKNRGQQSFNFEVKLDLEIENEMRTVFLGANVGNNYNEVAYQLAFCQKVDDSTLIRKFHFDYEINARNLKPFYHLQYGGNLSSKMGEHILDAENLQPWLSIPRISFAPINLALLLDLVFTEFKSVKTKSIIERSEWRDLIKKNETFLLKGFYQNISSFFNRINYSSNTLFRDFSYGE